MSRDTSMRIKKEVKERLLNLDFVKRQSESDLVSYLIDFYEKNKDKLSTNRGKFLSIRKKVKYDKK